MPKANYTDAKVKENLERKRNIRCSGCWEWTGAMLTSGYGTCKYQAKQVLVHRLSAWIYKQIPLTCEVVMHTCDNRSCFNPEHLEESTQQENMLDMKSKGRTSSAIGESY